MALLEKTIEAVRKLFLICLGWVIIQRLRLENKTKGVVKLGAKRWNYSKKIHRGKSLVVCGNTDTTKH